MVDSSSLWNFRVKPDHVTLINRDCFNPVTDQSEAPQYPRLILENLRKDFQTDHHPVYRQFFGDRIELYLELSRQDSSLSASSSIAKRPERQIMSTPVVSKNQLFGRAYELIVTPSPAATGRPQPITISSSAWEPEAL